MGGREGSSALPCAVPAPSPPPAPLHVLRLPSIATRPSALQWPRAPHGQLASRPSSLQLSLAFQVLSTCATAGAQARERRATSKQAEVEVGATGPARRLPPAAGMRQGAATHALLFITVLLPGSGGFLLPSQGVGCAGFYRSICVHGARDRGSHRATVLDAARKGDGKKPRLAKEGGGRQGSSSGGRQGSSSGGPGSAKGGGEAGARDGGPRIRNDIGMSMKTQLRLVKAFKQMEAKQASTKTVVRTGFRRKKATVQSSQDSSAPEMLRDIWNQRETPSHFFLDGYNIIGYWPKLKKKRDKGDMSGARDALFEAVSQFAHFRGCQCTLVYDAAGNTHGAPATSADMSRQGVEVVFVREESADRSLFVSLACARCRCGDLHRVPTRAGSLHALSLSVRFPLRDPCKGVTH